MITGDEPAIGLEYQIGLTIRQQFAMVAMQGLIANAPNGQLHNSKQGCDLATQWADDLIEALNK